MSMRRADADGPCHSMAWHGIDYFGEGASAGTDWGDEWVRPRTPFWVRDGRVVAGASPTFESHLEEQSDPFWRQGWREGGVPGVEPLGVECRVRVPKGNSLIEQTGHDRSREEADVLAAVDNAVCIYESRRRYRFGVLVVTSLFSCRTSTLALGLAVRSLPIPLSSNQVTCTNRT